MSADFAQSKKNLRKKRVNLDDNFVSEGILMRIYSVYMFLSEISAIPEHK